MLKILCTVVLLAAVLIGCSAQETLETVADEYVQPAAATPLEIKVDLPHEAAAPSMTNANNEQIYLCDGYTVILQTFASGDLEKTVQTVSGYAVDDLTVIKTAPDPFDRYDFVWSSAAEDGDQLGRACILDDGNYHYVLTCTAPEKNSGELQPVWNEIFRSFWAI